MLVLEIFVTLSDSRCFVAFPVMRALLAFGGSSFHPFDVTSFANRHQHRLIAEAILCIEIPLRLRLAAALACAKLAHRIYSSGNTSGSIVAPTFVPWPANMRVTMTRRSRVHA